MLRRRGWLAPVVAAVVAAGVLAPSTAPLWHTHAHAAAPDREHACGHDHGRPGEHGHHAHPGHGEEPGEHRHSPDDGDCTICVLLAQPRTAEGGPVLAVAPVACVGVVREARPRAPGDVRGPVALARGPPVTA